MCDAPIAFGYEGKAIKGGAPATKDDFDFYYDSDESGYQMTIWTKRPGKKLEKTSTTVHREAVKETGADAMETEKDDAEEADIEDNDDNTDDEEVPSDENNTTTAHDNENRSTVVGEPHAADADLSSAPAESGVSSATMEKRSSTEVASADPNINAPRSGSDDDSSEDHQDAADADLSTAPAESGVSSATMEKRSAPEVASADPNINAPPSGSDDDSSDDDQDIEDQKLFKSPRGSSGDDKGQLSQQSDGEVSSSTSADSFMKKKASVVMDIECGDYRQKSEQKETVVRDVAVSVEPKGAGVKMPTDIVIKPVLSHIHMKFNQYWEKHGNDRADAFVDRALRLIDVETPTGTATPTSSATPMAAGTSAGTAPGTATATPTASSSATVAYAHTSTSGHTAASGSGKEVDASKNSEHLLSALSPISHDHSDDFERLSDDPGVIDEAHNYDMAFSSSDEDNDEIIIVD